MSRSIAMCGVVAWCLVVTACSNVPSSRPRPSEPPTPQPESGAAAPGAGQGEAEAPGGARGEPIPVPPGVRHENLTCFSGTEDRQARIGVELIDGRVAYFAFYSKWRPRTCSLEAAPGDSLSRWTDNGRYSTVTLADHKGELRIEHEGGAYRFGFFNVDRGRYCGMPGKINGTLTVTRGKESCVVEGIMDGHAM